MTRRDQASDEHDAAAEAYAAKWCMHTSAERNGARSRISIMDPRDLADSARPWTRRAAQNLKRNPSWNSRCSNPAVGVNPDASDGSGDSGLPAASVGTTTADAVGGNAQRLIGVEDVLELADHLAAHASGRAE